MIHFVNGNSIMPPFPKGFEYTVFALGCFWGAERHFWQQKGVYCTAVGYIGGDTQNPTYQEVCTGLTGHAEAVLVVYDPEVVAFSQLLQVFFNAHNPTQGMRQGNDIGTQYRSGIYTSTDIQQKVAEFAKRVYDAELSKERLPNITTEILPAPEFYYAEESHQQYLAKNPDGYCGSSEFDVKYHHDN